MTRGAVDFRVPGPKTKSRTLGIVIFGMTDVTELLARAQARVEEARLVALRSRKLAAEARRLLQQNRITRAEFAARWRPTVKGTVKRILRSA